MSSTRSTHFSESRVTSCGMPPARVQLEADLSMEMASLPHGFHAPPPRRNKRDALASLYGQPLPTTGPPAAAAAALSYPSEQQLQHGGGFCRDRGSQKTESGSRKRQRINDKAHGVPSGSGFKTIAVAVSGCRVQRFRICVGNDPADIAQWIADRKRKFPRQCTDALVQPSKSAVEEVAKQGLATLLDGYGSSSDDEEEHVGEALETRSTDVPDDMKAAAMAAAATLQQHVSLSPPDGRADRGRNGSHAALPPQRPCHAMLERGSCRHGGHCRYSHDPDVLARFSGQQHERRPTNGPTTFLSKLLANDKRREETLTIQLLEYLAASDFLRKRIDISAHSS